MWQGWDAVIHRKLHCLYIYIYLVDSLMFGYKVRVKYRYTYLFIPACFGEATISKQRCWLGDSASCAMCILPIGWLGLVQCASGRQKCLCVLERFGGQMQEGSFCSEPSFAYSYMYNANILHLRWEGHLAIPPVSLVCLRNVLRFSLPRTLQRDLRCMISASLP